MSNFFATLWTVAHQVSLSMEFPRQEYWNGLAFPSPEILPDPRIEPRSPTLQVNSLPLSHQSVFVAQSCPTLCDPMDCSLLMGFYGGSVVKNPPAMQEMPIQSLGWEDPLEKEMATHSSILAWEIPWTEKTGGLQSMGSQKVRHN